jgi:hypothetical protein
MGLTVLITVAFCLLALRVSAHSIATGRLVLRGTLLTGSVATENAWLYVGQGDKKVRVRAEKSRLGDTMYEELYKAVGLKDKPNIEVRGVLVDDDNGDKFFVIDSFKII